MKQRSVCLFLLGVLALVGCASPPGPAKITATSALPASTQTIPLPTPSPIAINLTPLSQREAWGDGHMAQFSLDLGDRYFATQSSYGGASSITADDQMCGSTFPMRSTSADALKDVSSLGLIDLHTGTITLLSTLPTGYGVMSCAVTGSWVIWMQAYGNTLESFAANWQIKALNRQTQELRTLDQSQPPTGQNGPTAIRPILTASNGRVAWTTYSDTTPGSTQSEMYTFATATKTVLAPDTSMPLLSWPWASWGDPHQRAIVFKNLETGQPALLPMQYAPTTVAFAGTSFVLTNGDYSTVTLYPSITANPLTSYVIADKSVDGSGFNEFPSLNDRLVAWGSDSTSLVFDRKLMRQVQIDNAPGAGGFAGTVCSHFLVSEAPLTAADHAASVKGLSYHHVLRVIDINTLP